MNERRCPSCGEAALTRGFIYVRMTENSTPFKFASFVAGDAEQERAIVRGSTSAQAYRIEPHRCEGCGYVAWFAPTAEPFRT